jgi:hypothetical protein
MSTSYNDKPKRKVFTLDMLTSFSPKINKIPKEDKKLELPIEIKILDPTWYLNQVYGLPGKYRMTDVGLFSVTSYDQSKYLTQVIKSYLPKTNKVTIIDFNAGVGGNTVSLLENFNKVIAVEKSILHYDILIHNLEERFKGSPLILDKLTTENRDMFEILSPDMVKDNVIFFDPPWGGIDYKSAIPRLGYTVNKKFVSIDKLIPKWLQWSPKMIVLKTPLGYKPKFPFQLYLVKRNNKPLYQYLILGADELYAMRKEHITTLPSYKIVKSEHVDTPVYIKQQKIKTKNVYVGGNNTINLIKRLLTEKIPNINFVSTWEEATLLLWKYTLKGINNKMLQYFINKGMYLNHVPGSFFTTKHGINEIFSEEKGLLPHSMNLSYPSIQTIKNNMTTGRWLLKPAMSTYGGDDILLLEQINKNDIRGLPDAKTLERHRIWVLQKYLPSNVDSLGRKYDYRVHILTWKGKCYFHDLFLSRHSSIVLNLDDFTNTAAHLTNTTLQKTLASPEQLESLQVAHSFSDRKSNEEIQKIYQATRRVCTRLEKFLTTVDTNKLFFELYGLDLLVTNTGEVKLLEINANPAFGESTQVGKLISPKTLSDTFDIVLLGKNVRTTGFSR